ncbi:hypothetical protein AB3R30_13440 [Leptolyngbyaceae cyanobacterium UHCC 1019]
MGNDSTNNLARLYSELLVFLEQEEQIRKETEKKLAKARLSVDPRKEFNKWLQTNTGKSWEQKQFEYQECKCSACSDLVGWKDEGKFRASRVNKHLGKGLMIELEEFKGGIALWYLSSYEILLPF